jgi:hypothetical protein
VVAALFCRRGSVYAELGADVWDEARDARRYRGEGPVIAHPPCRGWGRLRGQAKVVPGELELAMYAVRVVRRCGGVLEHPYASTLWRVARLAPPGFRDEHGFTLCVDQFWFGHRAKKPTWLYIVGREPNSLPPYPLDLGFPSRTVEYMGRAERERTPEPMARWLLDVASGCVVHPAMEAA